MMTTVLNTKCGRIKGLYCESHMKYLGIRYARAERFEYATPVTHWEGEYNATRFGKACPQKRIWYPHLEVPERLFYYKEFREGIEYQYSEDCLNLNIFAPNAPGRHPVLVFIHGGGFDSGANFDSAIDGSSYANRGILFVSINYRVALFGYLTHETIEAKYGHDGNFGLHDQYIALKWIKENIEDYGGNPDNITVMGQSAGAISIQYLCLSEKCKGLFQHAIMLSGAGLFPRFALPRPARTTREYWQDLMQTAGASSFEEFKNLDAEKIYTAWETLKTRRKDNTYNTMPVVDGYLITAPIEELIEHPLPIDYMVGYTNNDMYAILMARIAHRYAQKTNAYLYYFDVDAPGKDKNGAFHSADLRYVFGTLGHFHRPYDREDREISNLMMEYICWFARTGNPNQRGLPEWTNTDNKALRLRKPVNKVKMCHPNFCKLLANTLWKGDPK